MGWNRARTYARRECLSNPPRGVLWAIGTALLLVVPLLIWRHPLMDPRLLWVPVVAGMSLLGVPLVVTRCGATEQSG